MTGEALSGEFLGPLLRTLAETLDVREAFVRISREARRIVPHDCLILGIMSPDRQRARVIALSGELPETAEEAVVSPELGRVLEENDALVWNDVKAQASGPGTPPGSVRTAAAPGSRSSRTSTHTSDSW